MDLQIGSNFSEKLVRTIKIIWGFIVGPNFKYYMAHYQVLYGPRLSILL